MLEGTVNQAEVKLRKVNINTDENKLNNMCVRCPIKIK